MKLKEPWLIHRVIAKTLLAKRDLRKSIPEVGKTGKGREKGGYSKQQDKVRREPDSESTRVYVPALPFTNDPGKV